ncbi:MAG: LLM class F420-dependent oxidoreductase [Candidatus Bathyarchaeota archaeon]|nr:LLM class F420-dependent oxidoreductase [Candidatus Bathyarchaeota archaeon]
MAKKISFGVFLPFYAFQNQTASSSLFSRLQDVVLECERLGYHSVWLDDHLMFGRSPILECWTTLAALSTATTRIRLGTMVTCASFRHPALLAKMAATLDVISGGRLEFGIGAGAQESEQSAYGLPFPEPRIRIERLDEALAVIKRVWTEDKASYTGKHYNIKDAVCEPKPIQKPHPPITVGGSGEKLTLKVTARHADRYDWGYVPSLALYRHKLDVLANHCRAVGRDFQEIERSYWLGGQVIIARNREEAHGKIEAMKPKDMALADFERTTFVGTPHECLEKVQPYVALGVSHFMLFFGDLPNLSSLRLFAETVLQQMQAPN